jgi:hypothetical protein
MLAIYKKITKNKGSQMGHTKKIFKKYINSFLLRSSLKGLCNNANPFISVVMTILGKN